MIGLASFWVERVFGLVYAFDLVMLLATGLLLPLELFPPPLYQILYNLPFRFFVYTPVLCLQGPITSGWLLEQISIGLIWIAVLVILVYLGWKKGLSKFSGYGI
jgi:ABC-2 type transport system permease protein